MFYDVQNLKPIQVPLVFVAPEMTSPAYLTRSPTVYPNVTVSFWAFHTTSPSYGRRSCTDDDSINDCTPGLILPAWMPPVRDGDTTTIAFRAFIYLISLVYILFGINVITDRILSAIEVIVSQKRTVGIKTKSGEIHNIEVPVWHHVVATLTVYVIGTSTPEIFMPIFEVLKRRFEADELGPSVVVGSGAYHLFCVTGVCLASVKDKKGKAIRDLRVFFVTGAFAIFAYLWIWILVAQVSPGVVELWEAVATLLLFPAIVLTTWIVERRFLIILYHRFWNFLRKSRSGASESSYEDEMNDLDNGAMLDGLHERRRRLAELLHQLRRQYPQKTQSELEELAEIKLLEEMPKDVAFYRMQAGKAFSGGGNVISRDKIKEKLREEHRKTSLHVISSDPNTQYVSFEYPRYTCIESCGHTMLTVNRNGPGIADTILTVDYEAFEGTARFGEDFEPTKGKLTFNPGQTSAEILVNVIDDDEFEDDKEFIVSLSKPVLKSSKISVQSLVVPSQPTLESPNQYIEIGPIGTVAVCILDDDHCGVFSFETPESAIADNVGIAKIKVVRSTGARGRVAVPYRVTPGSAKPNDDYIVWEAQPRMFGVGGYQKEHHTYHSSITFENDQFENYIQIAIVDKNRIGEVATFYIELLHPEIRSSPPKNPLGNPLLGKPKSIKLGICEDVELKEALDRLLKMADICHLVGTTSWTGQFKEAITVNFYDEDGDTKYPKLKLAFAYVIYGLSLPWKLLAAVLPPSHLLHGWVAFFTILAVLAFMAAIMGDLVTALGCTVGLKDSVTAMTLMAFGMGLPDTFASRHAAMKEKTADAAIGHITGSNAVSVFLGIGLSWTLAAAYHTSNNADFLVSSGSIGLSVTMYCIFATIGFSTLMLRRLPPIGGELGGPLYARIGSAIFFFLLWFTFVTLSILESYCVISGF